MNLYQNAHCRVTFNEWSGKQTCSFAGVKVKSFFDESLCYLFSLHILIGFFGLADLLKVSEWDVKCGLVFRLNCNHAVFVYFFS